MNVSKLNIILIVILVLLVAMAIIIRLIKHRKNNKDEKFNLSDFIDNYGDNITNVLKDVVTLVKIDESQYPNKHAYEKAIIAKAIAIIKENYKEIGIDIGIMNFIDDQMLAEIIHSVFNGRLLEIFSSLNPSEIANHESLFDMSVVSAAKSCIE